MTGVQTCALPILLELADKINISSEPVELKNKSFEDYVFDADDISFPCVCGNDITGILIYQGCKKHHLIGFIDEAFSLPVIPNGGNIDVTWDNGASKILEMKGDFIDLKDDIGGVEV